MNYSTQAEVPVIMMTAVEVREETYLTSFISQSQNRVECNIFEDTRSPMFEEKMPCYTRSCTLPFWENFPWFWAMKSFKQAVQPFGVPNFHPSTYLSPCSIPNLYSQGQPHLKFA